MSLVLRVVLHGKFGQQLNLDWRETFKFYAVGALRDGLVGLFVLMPVAMVVFGVGEKKIGAPVRTGVGRFFLFVWWALILFVIQAEYYFFHEYSSRFNTVAIDYLHYWTEVSSNIRQMYPMGRILTVCGLGALAVTVRCAKKFPLRPGAGTADRCLFLGAYAGLAALAVCGASGVSLQWHPERLVNELSSNGLTSGAIALWTRNLAYGDYFPTLPREEAYARARSLLDTPEAKWKGDPFSIQRRIPGDAARPKKNVVILLEESFGSEFLGSLNGRKGEPSSLTPRLDALSEQGLLFTNLFADGNRTIRGIEGVLASFPPLPGDSIVARTLTSGCETLASVFARDGYQTRFIYPGRGVFDGLGRFSLANGFGHFTEQKHFDSPVFTNVWGHCNEDLYDRVLKEAREDYQAGKPFFITALSVSNHQPFTYPEGRISEPSYARRRTHAVKYVDFALGRFFDAVRQEPFWKETLFVVIADHGARVYGSQTLPIHSYQIPCLVLGEGVEPGRCDTLGCQLDVAPTILAMVGRPYDSLFFGRDLLGKALVPRRAILNHNRSVGIYRDGRLVALSLNRVVEEFRGDAKGSLERVTLDAEAEELSKDLTALLQVADDLYMHRRFRWQPAGH